MKKRLLNLFHFFRMFVHLWAHHQISLRAAALTYALLLALIPLLAVCLAGGSLFLNVHELNTKFMSFLVQHLAPGSAAKVSVLLSNFVGKMHFKAIGYIGFGALLITCLLLLASIESSINRIWSIRKRKDLWKRMVIYNLLLVLGPATVSLSLSTMTFVARYFPNYVAKANIGVFLINAFALTFVYKIFPNKRVNWSAALFAGITAATACELAKRGYAIYTAKALFYNEVYGSLAVLPLFLIWVYVNWSLFLGGALLSYMVQHRDSFRLASHGRRTKHEGEHI